MAPGRYRLRQLLRGQRGSEHAMRDPVPAGARVVKLNLALGQPEISSGHVGLDLTWRVGPASRDVTDSAFTQDSVTLTGRGLRPLSPARLDAVRPVANSDIMLSWVRRTRIGGDSWEQAQVPLAEDSEDYEVEILDGETVVRSFEVSSPTVTYTETQQTTDFGAPVAFPDTLKVRVTQLSAAFGPGVPLEATLFFPLPVDVT